MAEHDEMLRKLESKLSAVLALSAEHLLRQHPDLGEVRPRTIEQILYDSGLSGVEIAAVLGKSPQAVSARLQTARGKRNPNKAKRTSGSGEAK